MYNQLGLLEKAVGYLKGMESYGHVYVNSDIGQSAEGFPIYAIKIGASERSLLSFAQIHGNEASSTAGIMNTITTLLSEPARVADVSFVCVPCLNPDGAKRDQRPNSRGVDVNRDFGIYEKGGTDFTSREARAAKDIMRRYGPSYVLDHHNTPFDHHDRSIPFIWYDFECFGNSNGDGLKERVEERLNEKFAEMGYSVRDEPCYCESAATRCGQLVNFAADNHCSATIIEAIDGWGDKSAIRIHTISDLEVLKLLSE